MPTDYPPESCLVIFDEQMLTPYSYDGSLVRRGTTEGQIRREYEKQFSNVACEDV